MFAFIKNKWNSLIKNFVPTPTKRMLVLSGIVSVIANVKGREKRDELVHKLNDKLNLALQEGSICFGLEIGCILWNDILDEVKDKKVDTLVLVDTILNEIPESLRYGDETTLRNDLYKAITFAKSYQC